MKIIEGQTATVIYPFVLPDGEASGNDLRLIIWPHGTIKLWIGQPVLLPEAAKILAQALLHAVEIAQKGQK